MLVRRAPDARFAGARAGRGPIQKGIGTIGYRLVEAAARLQTSEHWSTISPSGNRPMRCSKCGAENPADRKFCGECGTRFSLLCPKCGKENGPPFKFCGDCG